MTVTKREAQAALDTSQCSSDGHRRMLQALIDAMPDDPESREEMLGRVAFEAWCGSQNLESLWLESVYQSAWIAAAAAVAEQCRPREVTGDWLRKFWTCNHAALADRINAFVRGEDA